MAMDQSFKQRELLQAKVHDTATGPGVYLMKDADGTILYVGKALSLKKRLASYFNRHHNKNDYKTNILVSRTHDFDVVLTATEQEALILENTLIKRHKPRYNVMLKDGKRYPSLCLDLTHAYPNLLFVRKTNKKKVRYFGPFSSGGAVKQTLRFVNKTFKLRKCKNHDFATRTRPCLHYQMDACLGPCCLPVSKKEYDGIIREVTLFLNGRTPQLIRQVRQEMKAAADQQDFEQAAKLRDKLFALEMTLEKQVAVTTDFKDRDVLGVAVDEESERALVTVLSIRNGYLRSSRHFGYAAPHSDKSAIVEAFIRQNYEDSPFTPGEIVLSVRLESEAAIEGWLSEITGRKVTLIYPRRGFKVRLIEMAQKNAKVELRNRLNRETADLALLTDLQKALKLKRLPLRIECFDNSNLSGQSMVAAKAVFAKGYPFPEGYRTYKIRQKVGNDDYAAMWEVLSRRFHKDTQDQPFPDLVVVDGGKGQLNVALAVLARLGLTGKLDVIGLAKKDAKQGDKTDKVYLPNRVNPANLNRYGKVLLLLMRLRDATHNHAIGFQRKRREKIARVSALEEIPGIGPKRRKLLLQHFGRIEKIQQADQAALETVEGMTHSLAKAVAEYFQTR